MTTLPIVAALLLGASGGQAPGQARFAEAQASFAEGDFDGALSHLEAALNQAKDDELLAQIQLLRGQCYAAVPDQARASEAFTAALEHDPYAQLDKKKVRPSVVEILENLRETLQAELKVKTDRPGALVLLDGKTLGTAPITSSVSIGRHTLEVRNADGATVHKSKLVLKANEKHEVKVKVAAAEQPAEPEPEALAPHGDELRERKASKTVEEMAAEEEEPRSVWFVVDARGAADPFTGGKLGVGGELGVGVAGVNLGATLSAAYTAQTLGANLRALALVPNIASVVGLHFALGVPLLFPKGGLAVGALAGAGVDFAVTPWFAPYVEAEGRYYFKPITDASGAQLAKLAVQFGVGLRFSF